MLRRLHSIIGLVATLLLLILSISGTLLATHALLEQTQASETDNISVALLAQRIERHFNNIESIQRSTSGIISVYYSSDNGKRLASILDPQTGQGLEEQKSSDVYIWIKELHRSLHFGDKGSLIVGIGALALLLLSLSGFWLLLIRVGSLKRLFLPIQGSLAVRLHCEIGRITLIFLLLISMTGIYLSAVRFELISGGEAAFADFPQKINAGIPLDINKVSALANVEINDLQELIYPYMGDITDVYTLTTKDGMGYIDQATGKMLSYQTHTRDYKMFEFMHNLHSGEISWWIALVLGLTALSLPIMIISGIIIWFKRGAVKSNVENNARSHQAEIIILVGSESNKTWGFASHLHCVLTALNYKVCTTAMNDLEKRYKKAQQLFVLTSTFGDGQAPDGAKYFLSKLEKFTASKDLKYAVLGFGSRNYPKFCQYAKEVDKALNTKGLIPLMPLALIDKQSALQFSHWGRELGGYLNRRINLNYIQQRPNTTKFKLIEKTEFGQKMQMPINILRFAIPSDCNDFTAGDLIGIFAPNTQIERYYSLGSSRRLGFLEFCVRKQDKGICSTYLSSLRVGQGIDAFVKPNPTFKAKVNNSPLILIGAGTGIGPLIGFIRENSHKRPIHLYWGTRDPESDFLYQDELNLHLENKMLTEFIPAFSRVQNGCYVQDKLSLNSQKIKALIKQNAQIMVCGGTQMANEVEIVINKIAGSAGSDIKKLKAQRRYIEDIY